MIIGGAVYQPHYVPTVIPRCLLLPYFVSVGKRIGAGMQLAKSSGAPAAPRDMGRQTCFQCVILRISLRENYHGMRMYRKVTVCVQLTERRACRGDETYVCVC